MRKLNGIEKFMIMCTTSTSIFMGAMIGAGFSLEQGKFYDQNFTQPVEQVQAFFNFHNDTKEKYKNYIQEDKELLEKIGLPQSIINIEVLLKQHTPVDKIFYPLMRLGYKISKLNDSEILSREYRYQGKSSAYSRILNKEEDTLIFLGVNALEAKDKGIYSDFYKLFDNDQQKLTSFIFYHELGHAISHQVYSQTDNIKKILSSFERIKETLGAEDKKMISTQYDETFSDVFALYMMAKRYPGMDMKEKQELLAGIRYDNAEGSHLSAPGILSIKSIQNSDLNTIIKVSEQAALKNIQFYSDVDLSFTTTSETRGNAVKLIDINKQDITARMLAARQKARESQTSKLTYNN